MAAEGLRFLPPSFYESGGNEAAALGTVAIPNQFSSLEEYRRVFTQALQQQIMYLMCKLSKTFAKLALAQVSDRESCRSVTVTVTVETARIVVEWAERGRSREKFLG